MSFLAELKRRNVIRMAGLYLVGAWLIVQVTGTLTPMLEVPPWVGRTILLLLAIGFIPALVFSWIYEITPEGIKRESEVERHESITPETGQRMNRAIVALLVLAVGIFAVDRFVLIPKREAAARLAAVPPAPAAPAAPAINANSIAVLPFLDMSQAKDQEYFSDGLSEELLDLLAKVQDLRVIARTSSFSFKGKDVDIATIAKTLNVAHVLEGSVRKSGNTLRITAQLIRTADSTHLWSETYERELTDVFKVQDEIAGAVVAALKVKLLNAQGVDERRTRNIEAYNEYLLGKQAYHRTNPEGWRRAEAAFRRTVALDPGYAPAWAGLAKTLNYLSDYFGDDAAAMAAMKREAIVNAERAVALAPDLADAYEARAHMRLTISFDWKGAESDLERAVELEPRSSNVLHRRAQVLAFLGRLPEAIDTLRAATEVDPLSSRALQATGSYLASAGRLGEARELLQRAVALNPESSFALAALGQTELLDGKFEAVRGYYERAGSTWARLGAALAEHSLGRKEASDAALKLLIEENANAWAYQIAQAYAWRGEADAAFAWLERAYAQRDGGIVALKYDPLLRSLRGDARYAALLEKLGLPK